MQFFHSNLKWTLITVSRATRRDCDQIFELVNLAFKPEIGKTGIAYRKCDKYRLKDSARKHLEDMWVVKDNRKVSYSSQWPEDDLNKTFMPVN